MDATFLLLAVLAFIDSTSIGTLIIPIWFLLAAGRVQPAKFFLYLGTVAVFYFIVGVLGLVGFVSVLQALSGIFSTQLFLYVEIIAGIILFVLAFFLDPKRRASRTESRIQRWQRLVFTGQLSNKAVIGLALTATSLELASMAPYIAAIALLSVQAAAWTTRISLLAGYVTVMVLPAIALYAVRRALHQKVQRHLARFNSWVIKNADDIISWTVGIVGSALACDGLVRLIIHISTA